jgi:hypothetical protein
LSFPGSAALPLLISGGSTMNIFRKNALAICSIAAVSVAAYLPAVDNSFISDDFGIFPLLDALQQNPSYIFEASSELFRVVSYVYFWGIFTVFGSSPEAYYWTGIALHALVSILVYFLVQRMHGSWLAAFAAGLFFAVYERHQEAVMWISAANETILALNCVLFLLLWERATSGEANRIASAGAMVVFALALFSKEAAVVLAPMAVLILVRHGYALKDVIDRSIPIAALAAAYGIAWMSQADRNFFLTDGHYAAGFHAVFVYGRALMRLLLPATPFLAAWLFLSRGKTELRLNSALMFFAAFLALSIVPYSFLTYQDHIPSRHTYLPSIGLAAIIGIAFAGLHGRYISSPLKHVCMAVFAALLIGNGAYIWLKKEPQFRERAAPTRELFAFLNSAEANIGDRGPRYVCGFPLQSPWWFGDAVSRFTPFPRDEVILRQECAAAEGSPALIWDSSETRYINSVVHAAAQK